MATDVQHLKGPVRFASVQRLQNTQDAVAKEFPDRRFHALAGKVWRPDVLSNAWYLVRQLRGAPGVDGIKIKDIEKMGEDRWPAELSQELRRGEYKPAPVRAVRIPKKEPGKFRELGIPTVRERVVQTCCDAGTRVYPRGAPICFLSSMVIALALEPMMLRTAFTHF